MPPFYRMPIVYLAALVLATLAVVASVGRRPIATANVPNAPEIVIHPRPVPQSPGPPDPEPKDGILRTADGLRRKVVVKDLGVVCRSEPLGGHSVGPDLDYFSIHFVYEESPADDPRMVQIGPMTGPPLGWVSTNAVLEWDTRLMARPTPTTGRPPLVIYRERICLEAALRETRCPEHSGPCPIQGEEPGESTNGQAATLSLPILESETVALPDGAASTVFQVASLVRDQAPLVPTAAPNADALPLLRRIYVAFAIDTTASMQSSIDAARTVAAALVEDATQRYRDITLRLALVEYRDEAPSYGFRARIATRFTDPAGFRIALDRLKAARGGDGSVDESVLAGLATALPAAPSEPISADHLDWPTGRSGDLATKMLVLLGDAPDHAKDLRQTLELAARARDAKITIATVSLDRADFSTDERRRYQEHWHALAEGSFRPLDKANGFQRVVPPVELTLAKAGELAPRLQAVIDDRIEHARNLAALAKAEAEGRLAEYATSQGFTLDRIAPVLVDLHRGEPQPEARPDPRHNGHKAPSVRLGWIAEDWGSAPLVTVEVLMSRAELDRLIAELSAFQQAAQENARDLSDLLRIGTAAASGETAFLAVDRGDQTFADHLRHRQGLPPARADSLLHRSQADLLQADDLYRSTLDARLRQSIAQLVRRRNAPDWDDPARTIDGLALVSYESLDF
ncbi:MAG: vWA domain-containing protein [Isosphaeraceae bacterium]